MSDEKYLKLAYLAGLLDGEGCVGMYYNKVTNNYQLRITVEMVEDIALKKFQEIFGGKFYYKKAKAPKRARHSWMVFGSKAQITLKELYPFLLIKRKQADVVLQCDWVAFKGKPLTQEEKERRDNAFEQIRKLNERGYQGD